MNRNIWKKVRRVLAMALVIALCSNSTPQTLLQVKAADLVNIANDEKFKVEFKDESIVKDGVAEYEEGNPITPEVVVSYDGVELVEAVGENGEGDYKVSYENHTEVSTEESPAKVIITGTASENDTEGYYGTYSLTFKIVESSGDGDGTDNDPTNPDPSTPIELNSDNVSFEVEGYAEKTADGEYIFAYTGAEVKPVVKNVVYKDGENSTTLVAGTDYTVEYNGETKDATDGMNATITIKGAGNYTTSTDNPLVVNFGIRYCIDVSNTTVTIAEGEDLVYSGTEKNPEFVVNYTLPETEPTEPTDEPANAQLVVLQKDVDYTVTWESERVNRGIVNYTIVGTGEYSGEVAGTFEITAKSLDDLNLYIPSQEYNGNEISVSDLKVMIDNTDGEDSELVGCTLSYKKDDNGNEPNVKGIGNYTVVIEGTDNGNYNGTVEVPFEITKVTLTRDMLITSWKGEEFEGVGTTTKMELPYISVKKNNVDFYLIGTPEVTDYDYTLEVVYIDGDREVVVSDIASFNKLGSYRVYIIPLEEGKLVSAGDNNRNVYVEFNVESNTDINQSDLQSVLNVQNAYLKNSTNGNGNELNLYYYYNNLDSVLISKCSPETTNNTTYSISPLEGDIKYVYGKIKLTQNENAPETISLNITKTVITETETTTMTRKVNMYFEEDNEIDIDVSSYDSSRDGVYEDKNGFWWGKEVIAPNVTVTEVNTNIDTVKVYRTKTEINERNYLAIEIGEQPEWEVYSWDEDSSTWIFSGEQWEADTTYYFLAIDMVGNRAWTSFTTNKLDTVAPAMSVIVDEGTDKETTWIDFADSLDEDAASDKVYFGIESLEEDEKELTVKFQDGELQDGAFEQGGSGVKYVDDPDETNDSVIDAYTKREGVTTEVCSYTHTVGDNLGNDKEYTYTVIYDGIAPEIVKADNGGEISFAIADSAEEGKRAISQIPEGDEDKYGVKANGDVELSIIVNEDIIEGEEQLKELQLWKANEDGTVSGENAVGVVGFERVDDEIETDSKATYKGTYTITMPVDEKGNDMEFDKQNYVVIAVDKAGNRTSTSTVYVEFNNSVVNLSKGDIMVYPALNELGWTNKDTTFYIKKPSVKDDKGIDISRLEYVWTDGSVPAEDVVWTNCSERAVSGSEEMEELLKEYKYEIVEAYESFEGACFIRTVNMLGVASEPVKCDFKKDMTPPNANTINVSYQIGTAVDLNSENPISSYKSFVDQTLDRIFAKEAITATLYIDGEISGVSKVSYTYGDTTENRTVMTVSAKDGKFELVDQNDTSKTNTVSKVVITLPKNDSNQNSGTKLSILDNLHIISISDNAGNDIGETDLQAVEIIDLVTGTTELIIDNVAPVLDVEYISEDTSENFEPDDKNKLYFSPDGSETYEIITLYFDEELYSAFRNEKNEIIRPVVQYKTKNESFKIVPDMDNTFDAETFDTPVVKWTYISNSEVAYDIMAEIYLPYSRKTKGAEIEYTLKAIYADGSGNQVVASDNSLFEKNTDDDLYGLSSPIYVLDNNAPRLERYEIDGEKTQYTVGGVTYDIYKHKENGEENEDYINIEFEIQEDRDNFKIEDFKLDVYKFDSDALSNWDELSNLKDKTPFISISGIQNNEEGDDAGDNSEELEGAIEWSTNRGNGNLVGKYSLKLSNENATGIYRVRISYEDAAHNKLISGIDEDGNVKYTVINGEFASAPFIVDYKEPIINITYNNAYRLVSTAPDKDDETGMPPATGYVAYYGTGAGQIEVSFEITEEYAVYDSENGLKDAIVEIYKVGAEVPVYSNHPDKPEGTEPLSISWSQLQLEDTPNTYKGEFAISQEGAYYVTIQYHDVANNPMVVGVDAQNNIAVQGSSTGLRANESFEEDKYKSTKLVLDITKPKLLTQYTDIDIDETANLDEVNSVNSVNVDASGRKYYGKDVYLNIHVSDANIRFDEMINKLKNFTVVDFGNEPIVETSAGIAINGFSSGTINETGKYTFEIPLLQDGKYTIPIAFEDLAGNKATWENGEDVGENYKELVTVDKDATDGKNLTIADDIRTEIQTSPGFWERLNNAITFNNISYLFAKSQVKVTATVADGISGIKEVKFNVVGENGTTYTCTEPVGRNEYSVIIPSNEENSFDGTFTVVAYDWAGNNVETAPRGQIVEKPGTGTANVVIGDTAPSRVVDGVSYYKSDVVLTFGYEDSYAGLNNSYYEINSDRREKKYYDIDANGVRVAGAKTTSDSFDINLDINANDIPVSAGYTDNAGYAYSVSKTYNIDKVIPTVTVTYDLNNPANEKYYNGIRTATVSIQERNFSANDVQFNITNTDGAMPSISGWTVSGSGDDTVHRCTVTFAEDGDYTFTLSFMDMAGNVADYNRVDEFTIDRTVPSYTVTYDNNSSKNGYYYAAGRTATIDILEHNFDPALVNITMTATKGQTSAPTVSGWSRSGDHNIATIHFDKDADYTFDISGLDMAANPMAEYAGDRFVIDTKAPELEIFDIENMSANNGVVMPGIRYSDLNYDADSSIIEMVGFNNGNVPMDGDITRSETGVEIKLHDFARVPEMDDMYTMRATVFDLAGNSVSDSVTFSVNRFGSVYTFDEATDALIGENGSYYTRQEQDIVITETNVDTLEFLEITCNLNGKLITLEEGIHYKVVEGASNVGWKQYTYTLFKENFVEEGTYLITIYSKDRATNTSDNNSKGKKIEFVVDKTSPSVLVSGIEKDAQYRENSRQITIDVQDNVLLSRVSVFINGQEYTFTAAEVEEMNGKITLTVDGSNKWQTMNVVAYDAAGNALSSDEMSFLVTTNILVQLVSNKAVLFGTIAAIVVIGAGIFFLVAAKKKKREEQQ